MPILSLCFTTFAKRVRNMPIGLDNQLATAINKLAIAELRVGALLDKMGFQTQARF